MPFINGAGITAAGRVAIVEGPLAANGTLGGAAFNATQAVIGDSTAGAVDASVAGLSFLTSELGVVVSEVALVAPDYHNGLAFNAGKRLYVCTTLPPAAWPHGWPVASTGALCVEFNGVAS
jgi:hypothetical protein